VRPFRVAPRRPICPEIAEPVPKRKRGISAPRKDEWEACLANTNREPSLRAKRGNPVAPAPRLPRRLTAPRNDE